MHQGTLSLKQLFGVLLLSFVVLFLISAVAAWTGPTAAPPGNNVDAPINVGTTDQVKNGGVGVDALAVFGDELIQTNGHLNFGSTSGDSGYGIRDDNGVMEYKDVNGTWTSFDSLSSGNGTNGTNGTNGASLTKTDTFTSSGTWTAPPNLAYAIVKVWGGGGGGGNVPGHNTLSDVWSPAGGGGGGGYAEKQISASALASSEQVIVGSGGAGDPTSDMYGETAAGTGGTSSFTYGTGTVSAAGGQGGIGNTGGVGGSGTNGDTNVGGQSGTNGTAGGNGGNGGNGGSGGIGGMQSGPYPECGAPSAGSVPGGGGGGGSWENQCGYASGGAGGGGGEVIVYDYTN